MTAVFDTLKGRVILTLLVFLSASHVIAVWLYVQRSNDTTTLLHDALLADRVAFVSRLASERTGAERDWLLAVASGSLMNFSNVDSSTIGERLPEGSRPHLFEHLIGVFRKNRSSAAQSGLRINYVQTNTIEGLNSLLATVNASAYGEADHLPERPLAEIRPEGGVIVEISNGDGTWLRVTSPLLTVSPFSLFKLGTSLAALVASVLLVAFWVVGRWTQPLSTFAAAAQRLGTDINAPALPERGPREIRSASHAFNEMQSRIKRFVEDRTAFAAAIAHDLGTPVTRLQLRVDEVDDDALRARIMRDLEQMRRMITATLDFARTDLVAEESESFDLMSLVQRVRDDLIDLGGDVSIVTAYPSVLHSKPVSLRRALSNIAENAIKYGVRARISVEPDGRLIRIHVDDDGPGIAAAERDAAFRPFTRLDRNDASEGSGLGLSVARSILRGLGGDVTLGRSAAETFRVTLTVPR